MSVLLANSPAPVRNLLQRGLVEVHEYQIDLPPGTMPSLSADWATGTITATAVPLAYQNEAHLLGSSCSLPATFTSGNIVNPAGVGATCTSQTHTTPITASTMSCAVTVFCFTFVINFNFLNLAIFEFFCLAPGGTASWTPGSGATTSTGCFVIFFGALPNTFNNWQGFVGKDAAGPLLYAFDLD